MFTWRFTTQQMKQGWVRNNPWHKRSTQNAKELAVHALQCKAADWASKGPTAGPQLRAGSKTIASLRVPRCTELPTLCQGFQKTCVSAKHTQQRPSNSTTPDQNHADIGIPLHSSALKDCSSSQQLEVTHLHCPVTLIPANA